MAETQQSTIRLSDKDKANVDKIIKTGIATNTSEAIRVALAVAPQFLGLWSALISAKVDNIADTLTQLQDELRAARAQADYESLAKTHDMTPAEIRQLIEESPDGKLPAWLTHPIASVRTPAIGRTRSVRAKRRT